MKDLVIVGAGAVGLSLADAGLRAGLSVVVLDKGGIAREASWAGAGMLTCRPRLAANPARPDYYDLARWSVELHARWHARLLSDVGIDTGYRVCGALELSRVRPTPANLPPELAEEETSGGGDKETISKTQTAAWIAMCQARGVPARWIDEAEARRLEPELGAGVVGAIDFPGEAQVRNPWFTRALAANVRRLGGELREGADVVDAAFDPAGRVRAVSLADGSEVAGAHVAVCAGAWAGTLRFITQRCAELCKVQPVRGEILCYEHAGGLAQRLLCEKNHYIVPRGDGIVLVGATHEKAGFDTSTTARGLEELQAFAHSAVPKFAGLRPAKTWAGLRPGMKGRHPLIGPVPGAANLFVSAGHYRNGLTLAPASAELLAALILGRTPRMDPGTWLP